MRLGMSVYGSVYPLFEMIRSIGSPTNRPSLLVDYTVLRNVGRVILEGIEKKGDNVNSTDVI